MKSDFDSLNRNVVLNSRQYSLKDYSFCLYVYMPVLVGTHRSQKRVLDSLNWELQSVVNCPMCVLETKPCFSTRTAKVPDW